MRTHYQPHFHREPSPDEQARAATLLNPRIGRPPLPQPKRTHDTCQACGGALLQGRVFVYCENKKSGCDYATTIADYNATKALEARLLRGDYE